MPTLIGTTNGKIERLPEEYTPLVIGGSGPGVDFGEIGQCSRCEFSDHSAEECYAKTKTSGRHQLPESTIIFFEIFNGYYESSGGDKCFQLSVWSVGALEKRLLRADAR